MKKRMFSLVLLLLTFYSSINTSFAQTNDQSGSGILGYIIIGLLFIGSAALSIIIGLQIKKQKDKEKDDK